MKIREWIRCKEPYEVFYDELRTHRWEYRQSSKYELQPGDQVEFLCNGVGRGGHMRVCATVTKVKRKTFDCTENNNSYRPNTIWNIRKDDNTLVVVKK